MEIIDVWTLITEGGPVVIITLFAWMTTRLLGAAIETLKQTNEQQAQLCAKAQGLLEKELEEEKKARMVLERRFDERELEIERLKEEDKKKTERISELESEIKRLKDEDKKKQTLIKGQSAKITSLEEELEQVRKERDALRKRLEALEAVTKNETPKKISGKDKNNA